MRCLPAVRPSIIITPPVGQQAVETPGIVGKRTMIAWSGVGPERVSHGDGRGIGRMAWVALLGAATLLGAPGIAGATTSLLVHRDGQECTPNVPRCTSVKSALLTVRPDNVLTVALNCPAGARAFWNWAADMSPHTEVQLLEPIVGEQGKEVGARFAVRQQDGAGAGRARIHLGCSATRPSVARPISYRNSAFGWHPHQ
jgi:hypothetical protein